MHDAVGDSNIIRPSNLLVMAYYYERHDPAFTLNNVNESVYNETNRFRETVRFAAKRIRVIVCESRGTVIYSLSFSERVRRAGEIHAPASLP